MIVHWLPIEIYQVADIRLLMLFEGYGGASEFQLFGFLLDVCHRSFLDVWFLFVLILIFHS
jgi:hypothetical protein